MRFVVKKSILVSTLWSLPGELHLYVQASNTVTERFQQSLKFSLLTKNTTKSKYIDASFISNN